MSASHPRDHTVTAVLGPTNTGKTTYAIERMLGHKSGVMGFPLRLLAREVYDKVVALRGPSVVGLVTGEEKIVPKNAKYFICTVESMPTEIGASFLAVDEIQLCADPERGHVFTDRLLNARGMNETLFLGALTMRDRIEQIIPAARFHIRERFSVLTYAGSKKISRLPPRSAIVCFSTDQVYAIAELIRRQKGGAAVVMGALSPRTRNAQVKIFQDGEVDYLVATDAIGMGLNLDLKSVWFAGKAKFDGRKHRNLQAQELAQIAGRAGRYKNDGSFGVTADCRPLEPEVVESIEDHRFAPVGSLQWRNSRLQYASPPALLASLEFPAPMPGLQRTREGEDVTALRMLAADPDVQMSAKGKNAVRLLWDVCQIPDFRKTMISEHADLLRRLYGYLTTGQKVIPTDWMAQQIIRIDKTDGDIDVLSKRLAYIRTWTYTANRSDWLDDAKHWRERTRAVEDRLSDALHARLTQRFVDRRTSVLMQRLKQKEELVASVDKNGDVTVEGEHVGRIEGLRFQPDKGAEGVHATTLRAASTAPVMAELTQRVEKLYAGNDGDIDFTEQGGIVWDSVVIGRLTKGADTLSPVAKLFADELLEATSVERAERRLQQWIDRRIKTLFEPLLAIRDDEAIQGIAKGVVFQLVEALGVLPRGPVAQDVKSIEQETRSMMRKHGLRFGQYTLFLPILLKPAPARMRIMLWGIASDLDDIPAPPPAGVVTFPAPEGLPDAYFQMAGYRKAGDRALRLDMLERLADMTRTLDARKGFEATADMLSITGLTLEQFASLMDGLGYRSEKAERPKVKAATVGIPDAESEAKAAVEDAGALDEPLPVDAVINARTGAAALDLAPAATAHAEADTAAVEAVEADGPADVDAAPERPVAAPMADDAGAEALASGTGQAEGADAAEPTPETEPEAVEPVQEEADEGGPRPVDAVITEAMPGDALDVAPAATAYAEADMAAIEAVERGATDVDQAPERPMTEGATGTVTDDGAASNTAGDSGGRDIAPRIDGADEPMAAMSQPSSVPKEAEGKQVDVSIPDATTGEMETFYTFRILPRGRRQRGDQNRNQGDGNREGGNREGGERAGGNRRRQPKTEGGERPARADGGGRPDGKRDGNRKQGGKGNPRGGKPGQTDRQPKREYSAAPARAAKPLDPDSPFAILQKLKDGK